MKIVRCGRYIVNVDHVSAIYETAPDTNNKTETIIYLGAHGDYFRVSSEEAKELKNYMLTAVDSNEADWSDVVRLIKTLCGQSTGKSSQGVLYEIFETLSFAINPDQAIDRLKGSVK